MLAHGGQCPGAGDDQASPGKRLGADVIPQCIAVAHGLAPFSPGQAGTMVGYSQSGHGSVGVTVGASATVKRKGENSAYQLELDGDGSGRKAIFSFDFDGGMAVDFMGTGSLGNAVETTFAGGDSGSPSFIVSGSQG